MHTSSSFTVGSATARMYQDGPPPLPLPPNLPSTNTATQPHAPPHATSKKIKRFAEVDVNKACIRNVSHSPKSPSLAPSSPCVVRARASSLERRISHAAMTQSTSHSTAQVYLPKAVPLPPNVTATIPEHTRGKVTYIAAPTSSSPVRHSELPAKKPTARKKAAPRPSASLLRELNRVSGDDTSPPPPLPPPISSTRSAVRRGSGEGKISLSPTNLNFGPNLECHEQESLLAYLNDRDNGSEESRPMLAEPGLSTSALATTTEVPALVVCSAFGTEMAQELDAGSEGLQQPSTHLQATCLPHEKGDEAQTNASPHVSSSRLDHESAPKPTRARSSSFPNSHSPKSKSVKSLKRFLSRCPSSSPLLSGRDASPAGQSPHPALPTLPANFAHLITLGRAKSGGTSGGKKGGKAVSVTGETSTTEGKRGKKGTQDHNWWEHALLVVRTAAGPGALH